MLCLIQMPETELHNYYSLLVICPVDMLTATVMSIFCHKPN